MVRQLPLYVLLILTLLLSKEVLSQQQVMTAIEVRKSSPMFGESFYRVYHFGDLILYQSQYQFDSSEVHFKIDSSGQEMPSENTLLLSESRRKFFVFHKDSSYGHSYDPHDSIENGKRLRVDSVLKIIEGGHSDSVISKPPDSSSWFQDHSVLREVYSFSQSDSTPSVRVILMYSKNMDTIKESLCPAVDRIKKMKLFKIHYTFNKFYDNRTKKQWPAMEMLDTEMEVVSLKNAEEIMIFFEKYKRDISSN